MRKLSDIVLQEIAPPSINRDKNAQAICAAIDAEMRKLAQQTELVLLIPRLDELPEKLVDELAWQYHVDFYDYSADLTKKRNLVRQAIAWHKRKGTPAAVEEIVKTVFLSGVVSEWFEYGGEPYHFKVRLIGEALPDYSVIDALHRAIDAVKNTRSWLDDMSFYRESYGNMYLGFITSMHKSVSIYPLKFRVPEIKSTIFIGAIQQIHREVGVIQWQTGTDGF